MFSDVKALTIPDGEVTKITAGGVVLWEKITFLPHTNLVPTATDFSGAILDGKGYRVGAVVNATSSAFNANSAFTAIGLIPVAYGKVHEIYLYGLNFTGTSTNRYVVYNSSRTVVDSRSSLTDGTSGSIVSVKKLGEYYYKLTTASYSSKVKYFAMSGVTVSGLTPIVTMDEPIM